MRTSLSSAVLLLGTAALAVPVRAAAALNVVATVPGLAALATEVGGDKVRVESLSRGTQDPHFVDANPILAVKLRNAGLLIDVGLELEIGWLPPLVNQSRNADIQPGGTRRLTAANFIQVMDLPQGPVSRAQGDLHPGGNPHFLSDPRRAGQVAAAIAGKLAELDPKDAAYFAQRNQAFQSKLQADEARWLAKLAPVKGRKVFTRHRTMTYLFDWSGIVSAGEIEPRPGVPAPPAYLAELVQRAQREGVKAIVVENYYDTRSADVVARHSGAKVVQIPGDVGGEPAAKDYPSYLDVLVKRVVGGLQ